MYSQFTLRVILLLTAGGTSLLAMQRYAPICFLSSFCRIRVSPLNVSTGIPQKSVCARGFFERIFIWIFERLGICKCRRLIRYSISRMSYEAFISSTRIGSLWRRRVPGRRRFPCFCVRSAGKIRTNAVFNVSYLRNRNCS